MINTWKQTFWGIHQNKPVFLFKYENTDGSYAEVTNYGAAIKSVVVPDNAGVFRNVVLDFPALSGYQNDRCYLGATVGRFANRIANASYVHEGYRVCLESNDGPHQNHGGCNGFNAQVFDFEINGELLILYLRSPSGAGGFPGDVFLEVHYTWSRKRELGIKYIARTTVTTPLNITNHSYFNLSGARSEIWNHKLRVASHRVLETSPDYIPTGKIISSEEVYPHNGLSLGENLIHSDTARGLNDFFILDPVRTECGKSSPACFLHDPETGRTLEVFTTYPGLQIYTGDFLNSRISDDECYGPYEGICLECQFYPDSPNHKHFPGTFLEPSETYEETIAYCFGLSR
ncbi:aldose epimerase family protein [Sinomicrobium soli]|uniref:aldose epimerase family protein n=1 Tax=Sinomicrobium sp. N-1-3-6 TaxID=2219864 RepID=UPI001374FFDB|nr:aldose epimerase family protein [Sinomicrobium sp. N-1-3-6]